MLHLMDKGNATLDKFTHRAGSGECKTYAYTEGVAPILVWDCNISNKFDCKTLQTLLLCVPPKVYAFHS